MHVNIPGIGCTFQLKKRFFFFKLWFLPLKGVETRPKRPWWRHCSVGMGKSRITFHRCMRWHWNASNSQEEELTLTGHILADTFSFAYCQGSLFPFRSRLTMFWKRSLTTQLPYRIKSPSSCVFTPIFFFSFFFSASRNLLPISHVCTEDGEKPMVLLPFMAWGNLKLFLRQCKLAEANNPQVRGPLLEARVLWLFL